MRKILLVVLALIIILALWCVPSEEDRAEQAEEDRAEQAEDRRKGFNCLSPWDGDHDGLEDQVRALLNDPDSMDTYETRITPVDTSNNTHIIFMDFGAKNAFGGMVRSTAAGFVNHTNCNALLVYWTQGDEVEEIMSQEVVDGFIAAATADGIDAATGE